MNKKIIGWTAYVSILASIVAYNWLATPMKLISETYHRIEHKNGVIYNIDGKYENVLGWRIEGQRIWAVSNDDKTLVNKFARNFSEERILIRKSIKSLDELD